MHQPLKRFQIQALACLKTRRHVLCVAPTGAGKSRIFIEYLRQNPIDAVLVTPLIALGRQQWRQIRELPRREVAMGIGPDGGPPEFKSKTKSKIWIVSPERLVNSIHLVRAEEFSPEMLIVDECHCVWEWGTRFRPQYAQIIDWMNRFQIKRSLWLSATMEKQMIYSLDQQLSDKLMITGFFEVNPRLRLQLVSLESFERLEYIYQRFLLEVSPGILFCSTRKLCHQIENYLRLRGISDRKKIAIYHAGLASEERKNIEARCLDDQLDLLIATNAFGMGMDLPQFTWSILYGLPGSLTSLTQMIGRVGRNELPCRVDLFYNPNDLILSEWIARQGEFERKSYQRLTEWLVNQNCRIQSLESIFDPRLGPGPRDCGRCDICQRRRAKNSLAS